MDPLVKPEDDAVGFFHATDSICAIIYIGQPYLTWLFLLDFEFVCAIMDFRIYWRLGEIKCLFLH
jgi:hypothetical protein